MGGWTDASSKSGEKLLLSAGGLFTPWNWKQSLCALGEEGPRMWSPKLAALPTRTSKSRCICTALRHPVLVTWTVSLPLLNPTSSQAHRQSSELRSATKPWHKRLWPTDTNPFIAGLGGWTKRSGVSELGVRATLWFSKALDKKCHPPFSNFSPWDKNLYQPQTYGWLQSTQQNETGNLFACAKSTPRPRKADAMK